MKKRLIRKSKITEEPIDSLKLDAYRGRRQVDILLQAQRAWDSLYQFRKDRERNKNYSYGNQWCDKIEVDGSVITEESYISQQGAIPLKNNLIRRFVKTVLGAYRSNQTEPICIAIDRDEQKVGEMMTITLQNNWKRNKMGEIKGRAFEEYMISGSAFLKESFGFRNDQKDTWTDIVSPRRIFFDGKLEDVRHWDLSMIGEIHDIPFQELISDSTGFCNTPEDYHKLKQIYQLAADRDVLSDYVDKLGVKSEKNIDFLCPEENGMCRVIEIWNKEYRQRIRCHDVLNGDWYKDEVDNLHNIEAENKRRVEEYTAYGVLPEDIPLIEYNWFVDSFWYYRFISPFGDILSEGETPFEHMSHPYTIKLYPFIDGEVHSFVSDVIDQQRYTNRLITLYDMILRSSAKGVLMFPEELLPDGMDMNDVSEEWTKFNGVIMYKHKAGVPMPSQISSNSTHIGIADLLTIQMNLMEEVTGVHGAMQGKTATSGTSGALYNQQAQNASTSIVDLIESFDSFIEDATMKKVKNIQQFYTEKKIINIAGKSYKGIKEYLPTLANDIEFDISISESHETPAYRMMANDFLMEIWKRNQISLEMLLQNGTFPFADKLLQSLNTQKEQMANGQMPQGFDPAVAAKIQEQANPQAMQQLKASM
ncbi:MAG: hypothetical protein RR382_04905 [Tannerellaceae bacterium]